MKKFLADYQQEMENNGTIFLIDFSCFCNNIVNFLENFSESC